MRGSITLIAPGVLHQPVDTVVSAAAAAESLVRALPTELQPLAASTTAESTFDRPMEECVLRACYPDTDVDHLPVAALSYLADAGPEDATSLVWLRCDPVYLQPGGRGLSFKLPRASELSRNDADALVDELNQTLVEFDLQLRALTPTRWYLGPQTEINAQFCAPWVAGRDGVAHSMPQGRCGARWVEILTACQISLHTASVNAQREARGETAVSGVWLWGEGSPDSLIEPLFDRIYAAQGLAAGLGQRFDRVLEVFPAEPLSESLLIVCEDDTPATRQTTLRFVADCWQSRALSSLTIVDPGAGEITFNAELPSSTGILGRWRDGWRRKRLSKQSGENR